MASCGGIGSGNGSGSGSGSGIEVGSRSEREPRGESEWSATVATAEDPDAIDISKSAVVRRQ
jgi:hypothetical protein